jgi:hypothetical protein
VANAAARVELHSGLSRGTKLVLGALVLLGMLIVAPLAAVVIGVLIGLAIPLAGVFFGVCAGMVAEGVMISRMLWLLRSAAWLEGTTLAVRGVLGTRRCDLATAADLFLEPRPAAAAVPGAAATTPAARRVPRLVAYGAESGQRVRVPLRDPATKSLLSAPKLYALAGAILAGGSRDAHAREVAGHLRAMAEESARATR